MRMVDVNKAHRGVLIWREDIIKCARHKLPLSGLVRDLLHAKLGAYELDGDGRAMLTRQIEAAQAERKRLHPGKRGYHRSYAVDVMAIPAKVRKSAQFVPADGCDGAKKE